VISVPEIDHNTTVTPTAVTFGFGTAAGLTAGGQDPSSSTPEPATVTELIAGGALLLAVGWKRRNQAQR
jgi:hypothetical protein